MIDSDVLNSDVTLTGVMEGKTFTITIKSNNSNNQTRTYTAKYGERFTLPSCPFSAVTNYTFNNYTCNGSNYSVGGGFTVTGNMTVTCNWTYHAPAPPAPANNFTVKFTIAPMDDSGGHIVCYAVPKVTGSYKNKEIGVRFYWGGDSLADGYRSSIQTDKPITEDQYFGYPIPSLMGEIYKIELRNGYEGAVLATKNVTLIKGNVTTITMTLS